MGNPAVYVSFDNWVAVSKDLEKYRRDLYAKQRDQVERSGDKIRNDAQRNLQSRILTITMTVRQLRSGMSYARIKAPRYGKYIEFGTGPQRSGREWQGGGGVTGKVYKAMPPRKKIKRWMRQAGIAIGTGKELDSQAFLIAEKIFHEGTKPRPFLLPAFDSERPKYEAAVKRITDEVTRRYSVGTPTRNQ